jgi:tetratricopeptide (TPR) repeat protein
LELYENIDSKPLKEVSGIHKRLGQVYKDLGQVDQAVDNFKNQLELDRSRMSSGEWVISIVEDLYDLAVLQMTNDNSGEALEHVSEAAELMESTGDVLVLYYAYVISIKGNCLINLKRYEEALKVMRLTLKTFRAIPHDKQEINIFSSLTNIAGIHKNMDNLGQAVKTYQKTLSLIKNPKNPGELQARLRALYACAECHFELKQFPEALGASREFLLNKQAMPHFGLIVDNIAKQCMEILGLDEIKVGQEVVQASKKILTKQENTTDKAANDLIRQANVYFKNTLFQHALDTYNQALELKRQVYRSNSKIPYKDFKILTKKHGYLSP